MVVRQLSAATARSAEFNSVWTGFSAAANVEGETLGPTAGAVRKAGGAPGGNSAGFGGCFLQAAAALNMATEAPFKKCLRDSDMFSPSVIRVHPCSSAAKKNSAAHFGNCSKYWQIASISCSVNLAGGMMLPGDVLCGSRKCFSSHTRSCREPSPSSGGPTFIPMPLIWWQEPQ